MIGRNQMPGISGKTMTVALSNLIYLWQMPV